jgi:hypothetical protein
MTTYCKDCQWAKIVDENTSVCSCSSHYSISVVTSHQNVILAGHSIYCNVERNTGGCGPNAVDFVAANQTKSLGAWFASGQSSA